MLFPFATYWWAYGAFTLFVLTVLVVDLGVFHRRPHVMRYREAATWCVVWPTLALLFCLTLWWYCSWRLPLSEAESPGMLAAAGFASASQAANTVALQFLTGYIVEQSLSVDNIFVFVVIFRFFAVPAHLQHRVLFYGIIGAVAFRAAFIALGAVLLQYAWVVWIFSAFLVLTGIKLLITPERPMDLSRNPVLRIARRLLPVTHEYRGASFVVREGGRRIFTPLFLALVVVEATDVIFAVDSVPAIFAITREPLIVFTSNIFAILGLRALYFLLAGAMDSFHLLRYGLGIVLIFVGAKMTVLNELFDGHFPIVWSLVIICGVIGASVVASLLFPKRAEVLDSSEGPGAPEMPEASDVPDASEDSHASGGHAARRS